MRVHHLNCGTCHPVGGRLVHGEAGPRHQARIICHVLLLETDQGLVLVDSGIGLADVAAARARLGGQFVSIVRPTLDPEETALRQIERLSFSPRDVRHIVLTHLDLDHAGGLADFPEARVHVLAREHDAAMAPTFRERSRYRAVQWEHGPRWSRYEPEGEPFFGFECVRQLEGLPPEILMIPLLGHTRGHSAVAVQTSAGWLLHAGDAYFHHGEMDPEPHCPVGLRILQSLVQVNGSLRLYNQERLRELVRSHGDEVRVVSAHDPGEWERAAQKVR